MIDKLYLTISGVIFALIGLFHLLRIMFQWPAMVGTFAVPIPISLMVIVLAGGLAFWAFRLSRTLTV